MVVEDEDIFPPEAIQRDRWGRPLIIVDGSPKAVPYTRCSTYAKSLSDTGGLTKWKMRQVVKGLKIDHSPLGSIFSVDRNDLLDAAIEAAFERAGANESARKGTTIHGLTEWVDLGVEFDPADYPPYGPFIEAYRNLTTGIGMLEVERFVVNDELQVAGTFDRLSRLHDGRVVIGDLKTGTSAAKNPHDAAIQMAVYSRSEYYDPETGQRSPIVTPEGEPIDTSTGLLIHLPSNGDKPGLYLLNLDAAWDAALLARQVRVWRNSTVLLPYFPY